MLNKVLYLKLQIRIIKTKTKNKIKYGNKKKNEKTKRDLFSPIYYLFVHEKMFFYS